MSAKIICRHRGRDYGRRRDRRCRHRCGQPLVPQPRTAGLAASQPGHRPGLDRAPRPVAIATGRAWNRAEPRGRRRLATVLGINLCLNAAWPWVFFRAHRPALGSAVIGGLEASSVVLTREVARADRKAAVALLPYLGWNLFALVLNTTISVSNRPGRSRG